MAGTPTDRHQEPLRIAYVVKMFPRLSETFILNEILEHERNGVEVTVFSLRKPNEGRFHRQLSELKADVIYLDDLEPRKWGSWLSERWNECRDTQSELWKLVDEEFQSPVIGRLDLIMKSAWATTELKRRGIQHIHAHFATLPSTAAYYMSRISGITFSFTAHAKDIYVYTPEETLLREKLRQASKLVTVTEFNRRHFVATLPDCDVQKVVTLYNGVDLSRFSVSDAPLEKSLIVGVGRLVPKKGFADLLAACAKLKDRGVSFRCVIAGDGQEREALLALREELNLGDCVEFPGAVTSDEALEYIRRATVVALPCVVDENNNVDALPTALLESLACGVPAVSTRLSGIPEIIEDGVEGALVEPHDTDALADSIARIMSDPGLRDEMAVNARRTAEKKFSLRANVATLRNMFVEAIDGASVKSGAHEAARVNQ